MSSDGRAFLVVVYLVTFNRTYEAMNAQAFPFFDILLFSEKQLCAIVRTKVEQKETFFLFFCVCD